eukprot:jgi/Psemu1/199608/e_gw1.241.44.1
MPVPLAINTASALRTAGSTALRRSPRLRGIVGTVPSAAAAVVGDSEREPTNPTQRPKRSRSKTAPKTNTAKPRAKKATATKKSARTTTPKAKSASAEKDGENTSANANVNCLPRTEEQALLTNDASEASVRFVLGVDEAGRGPLAGPVVAAAAIVPVDLEGITDSKKLTKEERREELYDAIVASTDVRWAVAVMDAPFIDEVNILQATLRGMAAAASALVDTHTRAHTPGDYYALIDGNKVPPDMPCKSHSIVKGDGKEYSIAAASILAKVTRDRLMRGYHELWPHYGLDRHKGYPTAAHMQAVRTHGASPIHRRTFRPLKDMSFDENGRILEE